MTAEGQAMLKIYASAVGKMMDTTNSNPGNPSSWLFQWYTHAVPDDRTKNQEILRIYPNSADPDLALAKAMWNTCEAHFSGKEISFFLGIVFSYGSLTDHSRCFRRTGLYLAILELHGFQPG